MIKKLMAATSVAALIVGGANAQLALKQAEVSGALTEINAPYVLAEEVDFTKLNTAGAVGAVGSFGLAVTTEGIIPPGQNLFLTIKVTNGTIASNLNGSEIEDGITGAVVNAGGTKGATSVRYLITTDGGDESLGIDFADLDGVSLNLPIIPTSCGDVTFEVTEFETETAGTQIEGGSAVLTDGDDKPVSALTCESAFEATLVLDDDNSALALDPTGALPAFSEFVTTGNDTTVVAILGDFAFELNTDANVNMVGLAADYTDVLGFKADIDLESVTNVDSGDAVPDIVATGLFQASADVTGSDINLVGTTVADADDTGTFQLTIEGDGPVLAQSVSVSDAVLDLKAASPSLLQATDAFTKADVEDLKYEGFFFGPFDWVSDSTKAVNSIFRITGLSTTEDVPAQIIVENARNGSAFDGVYPFTILGSSVQGSEVRVNSAQLEAIAGKFGTADISMVFSTENDLDVDRLNASPSSSVVTPFGDNANAEGSGESTSPGSTENDDEGNF